MKKDEEETKELWKRKREHEEQWEGTRENRVSFQCIMYLAVSEYMNLADLYYKLLYI